MDTIKYDGGYEEIEYIFDVITREDEISIINSVSIKFTPNLLTICPKMYQIYLAGFYYNITPEMLANLIYEDFDEAVKPNDLYVVLSTQRDGIDIIVYKGDDF